MLKHVSFGCCETHFHGAHRDDSGKMVQMIKEQSKSPNQNPFSSIRNRIITKKSDDNYKIVEHFEKPKLEIEVSQTKNGFNGFIKPTKNIIEKQISSETTVTLAELQADVGKDLADHYAAELGPLRH